jgi:hypothetical protein
LLFASSNDGIRIYHRTAKGNDKPIRTITGEDAEGASLMTTNPASGMVFAAVRKEGRYEASDFVGIWSIYDNGSVPARWTVGGPNGVLKDIRGIAVDTKNKTVIASDKTLNAVLTFHVPEAF